MECGATGRGVRGRHRRVRRRGPGPAAVFQRLLPERPTSGRCVEAYYLQRTRFESIAERKLRRQQLTEDGNVKITGRDLLRLPKSNGRFPPATAATGPPREARSVPEGDNGAPREIDTDPRVTEPSGSD
jgi:hypothetical protein